MYGIEENGVGVLLLPHIHEAFGRVMKIGNADARPEEVNRERVIQSWELPVPKVKKQKGKRLT